MPLARAMSAMDAILSSIISSVDGPVLPAMSLVPASITTTLGFNATTSGRKRTSICGVVCPLIPRLMYGFPANMVGKYCCQPSVIEFPMKTTRFSPFAGGTTVALASRYLARFAQSVRSCWSVCAVDSFEASTISPSARATVLIVGLCETLRGTLASLEDLHFAIARWRRGLQGADQFVGCRGDFFHGCIECVLVGAGRLAGSTQLADELKRGCADFVVGGWGFEVGEGFNVPAHARSPRCSKVCCECTSRVGRMTRLATYGTDIS